MAFGNLTQLTVDTTQVGSSVGTIFTATAETQVCAIVLHNKGAGTCWVEIYKGGVNDSNMRYSFNLEASETVEIAPKVPICMADTQTISAQAETAAKINIQIVGRVSV